MQAPVVQVAPLSQAPLDVGVGHPGQGHVGEPERLGDALVLRSGDTRERVRWLTPQRL